jgi:hypothetical protein
MGRPLMSGLPNPAQKLQQLNQRLAWIRQQLAQRERLIEQLSRTQQALRVQIQRLKMLGEAVQAERQELSKPEPSGLGGMIDGLMGGPQKRQTRQQRFQGLWQHYQQAHQQAQHLHEHALKLQQSLKTLEEMETEEALVLAAKNDAISEVGGERARRLNGVAEQLAHTWADTRDLEEAINVGGVVRETINHCLRLLSEAGEMTTPPAKDAIPPAGHPSYNPRRHGPDAQKNPANKHNGSSHNGQHHNGHPHNGHPHNGHAIGHPNGQPINGHGLNGHGAPGSSDAQPKPRLSCIRLEEALAAVRRAVDHLGTFAEALDDLGEDPPCFEDLQLFCQYVEHYFHGRLTDWPMRERIEKAIDAAVVVGTRVDQKTAHLRRQLETAQMRAERLAETRRALIETA